MASIRAAVVSSIITVIRAGRAIRANVGLATVRPTTIVAPTIVAGGAAVMASAVASVVATMVAVGTVAVGALAMAVGPMMTGRATLTRLHRGGCHNGESGHCRQQGDQEFHDGWVG